MQRKQVFFNASWEFAQKSETLSRPSTYPQAPQSIPFPVVFFHPTRVKNKMKNTLPTLLLTLGFFTSISVHAADYYVSEKGNDNNPGTSDTRPFLTLKKAHDAAMPGDTVWVMAGTYQNSETQTGMNAAVLEITRSGRPDAWITWRNYKNDHPQIVAINCVYAIHLRANYVVIDGLTLTGNNDNVRQADAERNAELDMPSTLAAWAAEGKDSQVDYSATPNLKAGDAKPAPVQKKSALKTYEQPSALFNSAGVGVDTRSGEVFYHHHVLRNLVIRKFGTAGIALLGTDYATLENNEIYDNAWYGRYGSSGVTFNNSREFDQSPEPHIVIRGNRIYNNKNLVRCFFVDHYTDGNGLILDSLGNYTGGILVENNLVYNNGGAGIHIFKSFKSKIDVVHNTVWRNQQLWTLYDMGAHFAANIRFMNNIVIADKYRQVNGKNIPNVTYDYNIYWGSPLVEGKGPNDLMVDPQLLMPATNRKDANFGLQATSPAIDSAGSGLSTTIDFAGNPRPSGKATDRGAYEFMPTNKP
jgi:hypothetical protein